MPIKSSPRDKNIIDLAYLRDNLLGLMNPDILKQLANLLEALGSNNSAFVHQFRTWVERNGSDCRYANMARKFFLENQSENVAMAICELYNHWAKFYDKQGAK